MKNKFVLDLHRQWMERYPAAFAPKKIPLAVGIREQIAALHPDTPEKLLKQALASWCGRASYLYASLKDGATRVNLDGSDAGEVGDEGRRLAQAKLDKMKEDSQASIERREANKAKAKAEQELARQQEKAAKKAAPAKKPQTEPPPAPVVAKPAVAPTVIVKKKRVIAR